MELAIFFYVADVVENFTTGLTVIFACWVVGLVLALVFFPAWHNMVDDLSLFKRVCKWSVVCLPALLLVSSFIPSKNTMYTMAAAYGVQSAAENPDVQRLAGKSLKLLEDKIDDYLKPEAPSNK